VAFVEHPKYAEQGLLDRLVEPEPGRDVPRFWVDDHGQVQVNRGCCIQHSMAMDLHKGGLRCPSVTCRC
jgi:glutamate dehydrogenase (NADP+)